MGEVPLCHYTNIRKIDTGVVRNVECACGGSVDVLRHLRHINIFTCQHSNITAYQYTNIPAYQHTNIPIYQHPKYQGRGGQRLRSLLRGVRRIETGPSRRLQGYLAHEKTPPPQDHNMAIGAALMRHGPASLPFGVTPAAVHTLRPLSTIRPYQPTRWTTKSPTCPKSWGRMDRFVPEKC